MIDDPNDDSWPFAMGTILGGDVGDRVWAREIGRLELAARAVHAEVSTLLRVNVVFFVDGRVRRNDFTGVRTGSFFRKESLLIVQAAIYPGPGGHPATGGEVRAVVVPLLWECVDVAEAWARKKGIAESLPGIRRIIDYIEALPV